jgi:hypothetical protein
MHSHRNGRAPSELPDPDSRAYEAQKLVLLELVVDPPPADDHIDTLCELLELARDDIVAKELHAVRLGGPRGRLRFDLAAVLRDLDGGRPETLARRGTNFGGELLPIEP